MKSRGIITLLALLFATSTLNVTAPNISADSTDIRSMYPERLYTDSSSVDISVSDGLLSEVLMPIQEPIDYYTEPSYTDDDLRNLAVVVCREAANQTDEIQMLVANVVINRVNSPKYPETVEEVLTQYKQYGTMWRTGIEFPNWAGEETIQHCYDIARRILEGERVCPENVLFQAEFKQGNGVYKEFDGFYFCYLGELVTE